MSTAERLFLSDAEIATRLGLKKEEVAERLTVLERQGFPRRDPMFHDRRYWPAVREFLDRRAGLRPDAGGGALPLQPDGKENW
jgi:hypothetical protein